jgi:hypothetical protein
MRAGERGPERWVWLLSEPAEMVTVTPSHEKPNEINESPCHATLYNHGNVTREKTSVPLQDECIQDSNIHEEEVTKEWSTVGLVEMPYTAKLRQLHSEMAEAA